MRRGQLLDQLSVLVREHAGGDATAEELTRLCEQARQLYGAVACSVAELHGDRLHYVAAAGAGANVIVGTELPTSRGIGGYVAVTGQALAIDDTAADTRFARDVAERTGYVPRTMLVLPILDPRGEVAGILSVLDRRLGDAETPEAELVPAWSEPFLVDAVTAAPHLGLPGPASPEWAYGDRRGRGVRVAIIDSGIEADHPLVGGVDAWITAHAEGSGEGKVVLVEEPHDDLYGHGTACAGLIRRLAPDVELASVRVLGPNLRGSADAFAAALGWCIENNFDLVNLSLSTSNPAFLPRFWELLDRAAFAGVLLVSAMNNERTVTIPSELAGVCSVACGPGQDLEAVWANANGPPEWAAAGLDLEVAWKDGARVLASGNSFSAAVVSGHLARILGAHPGIKPWQARTVLAAMAANAPDRA